MQVVVIGYFGWKRGVGVTKVSKPIKSVMLPTKSLHGTQAAGNCTKRFFGTFMMKLLTVMVPPELKVLSATVAPSKAPCTQSGASSPTFCALERGRCENMLTTSEIKVMLRRDENNEGTDMLPEIWRSLPWWNKRACQE